MVEEMQRRLVGHNVRSCCVAGALTHPALITHPVLITLTTCDAQRAARGPGGGTRVVVSCELAAWAARCGRTAQAASNTTRKHNVVRCRIGARLGARSFIHLFQEGLTIIYYYQRLLF
jgi:hypothetical protein